PPDDGAPGRRGAAAGGPDRARRLDGGRGRSRRRPRPARPGRAVGRPARGDRARPLRRPHAAGDRRPDRHAARDGQEPDATRPPSDATQPRSVGLVNGQDDVKTLTCDEVREMAGAFVLGALDPAEAAAVRAHLATCDDAHEEIAELGGVLPALRERVPGVEPPELWGGLPGVGESVPVFEPPEGLKARIMAAAAADLEERTAGVAKGGAT